MNWSEAVMVIGLANHLTENPVEFMGGNDENRN